MSITAVLSPSDFRMLKNLITTTHSHKYHTELAEQQWSGFHCQKCGL